MQYLSLKELCTFLSISAATGRNWLSQGKLKPSCFMNHAPFFSAEYAAAYRSHLLSAGENTCKSRRNKAYITETASYASYISPDSPNHALLGCLLARLEDTAPSEELLSLILAEYALRLLMQAMPPEAFPEAASLADDLLSDKKQAKGLLSHAEKALLPPVTYVPSEDTLGFLYLSLKQLKERKCSGAYYTPPHIVKKLVSEPCFSASGKQDSGSTAPVSVLDPSCGTGSFLLQLPEHIPLSSIYGIDIDPVAVALTRINLLLRQLETYKISSFDHPGETAQFISDSVQTLRSNIRVADFLSGNDAATYTCILGNPPWGSYFSPEESKSLKKRFSCATHARPEAYDLFIEQALRHLAPGGRLSFVLPEAVLTVKAHTEVRKLLLSCTSIRTLTHLGNCFDGVFCPSILLTLEKTGKAHSCIGMRVTAPGQETFTIKEERSLSADGFCLFSDDTAYALLQKLLATPDCVSLKGNADFALGIVTGNNRTSLRPISAELHTAAPTALEFQDVASLSDEYLPVLRGSDLQPYHVGTPAQALAVPLSYCQQAAPEQLYTAPEKLLYRFISDRLIFAYDDNGCFPLNSCNVVIPHIEGLSMQYILAVFNSRILQFLYREQFRSVKVLRSQLEQLPIPRASKKEQENILSLVTLLMQEPYGSEHYRSAYDRLDTLIAALFHLTKEEYALILRFSSTCRT
ncbi:MAG: N-6 DNA methylase [Lachnospiraceae bacterium]